MLAYRTKLKVLTINIDYTLAMEKPTFGDAQQRNADYGKKIEKLISITHSHRKRGLSSKKLSENVIVYPTSSVTPLFFIFDALKIAKKVFAQEKIDLVLSQDPFITGLVAYLIKLKYKCKFLIHFHGDFWQNRFWIREKWYNPILIWLSRYLVKRADGIRVVSTGIKNKLVKAGLDKSKIRVIPTPVDINKFESVDRNLVNRIKASEYQNKKTVINVGRNDKAKDYPTLFRAIGLVAKENNNFAFCQIGAGCNLREKINNKITVFKSFNKISQHDLIAYYHASCLYVSASCHESLGKVLIEAMASGLPVVATATTGSKDIVLDKKSGYLVPVGDFRMLAEKILFLLNNPEKAKKMGRAGHKIVKEKFDRNKIIAKTIQFWQDLSD